jgi:SecD/SecF fusion protein
VLTRSLATSFSTLLPVTALLIFGGQTLKDFAFALLVGIASGAYSSIFIASPVLTHWKEREPGYTARRHRIEEQYGYVPAFATVTRAGVPEELAPAAAGDGDGRRRRAKRRAEEPQPQPQPETELEPVLDDGLEDEEAIEADGDQLEPELDEEEAAVVRGSGAGDGAARKRAVDAVRAERAELKKRARQRPRRKHGRRR